MVRKILIVLMILISFNAISQLKDKSIVLKTKSGKIKGSLLCPNKKSKIPIVLIISGSGPTDRNGNNPIMTNNSLKMLAEGLFEKGIASLRYDKRGVAKSKNANLNEIDLRFENYIEDAKSWVDLLNKDKRFSDIIIAGHSEGSLIGMIASQKNEVSKFISIAGAGMPAADIIREQLKSQPPIILDKSLSILEKLENGEPVEDIPKLLYPLFRPSVQPYMISWFQYDPQKEIAKLNKPILIVQGTTDIQVSLEDANKLKSANENSEKILIEDMNHVLKESEIDRKKNIETYSNPDLPIKRELINNLDIFIKK